MHLTQNYCLMKGWRIFFLIVQTFFFQVILKKVLLKSWSTQFVTLSTDSEIYSKIKSISFFTNYFCAALTDQCLDFMSWHHQLYFSLSLLHTHLPCMCACFFCFCFGIFQLYTLHISWQIHQWDCLLCIIIPYIYIHIAMMSGRCTVK